MIFDTSPTNLSNHNLKVRGQVSENPVNLITQAGSHLRELRVAQMGASTF